LQAVPVQYSTYLWPRPDIPFESTYAVGAMVWYRGILILGILGWSAGCSSSSSGVASGPEAGDSIVEDATTATDPGCLDCDVAMTDPGQEIAPPADTTQEPDPGQELSSTDSGPAPDSNPTTELDTSEPEDNGPLIILLPGAENMGLPPECIGPLGDGLDLPGPGQSLEGSFSRDHSLEAQLNALGDPADPPQWAYFTDLVLWDVDGDRRVDMGAYNSGSNLVVLFERVGDSIAVIEPDFGVPLSEYPRECTFVADLDGDSHLDLFCAGNETIIWGNAGGLSNQAQRLTENYPPAPIGAQPWDVDQDGLMDVLVFDFGNNHNRVYINQGNRQFIEWSKRFDLDDPSMNFISCMADFTQDGSYDYHFLKDGFGHKDNRNRGYRVTEIDEEGYPEFDLFTAMNRACDPMHLFEPDGGCDDDCQQEDAGPMGCSIGDLDGDGSLEIFYTETRYDSVLSYDEESGLWKNIFDLIPGLSHEDTGLDYLGRFLEHWNSVFWDFDHDGFLDLIMTSGNIPGGTTREAPIVVLHGQPGPDLVPVQNSIGVDAVGAFRSLLVVDWDGDGDRDLFVGGNFEQEIVVYTNEIVSAGNRILVELRGTSSNPQALGSQLLATKGEFLRRYQWGDNFASRVINEPFLEIGMGPLEDLDELLITWPTGHVQRVLNIPADGSHLLFTEPEVIRVEPASRHIAADGQSTLSILAQPMDDQGNPTHQNVDFEVLYYEDIPAEQIEWIAPAQKDASGTSSRQLRAPNTPGSVVVEISVEQEDGSFVPYLIRPRIWFD